MTPSVRSVVLGLFGAAVLSTWGATSGCSSSSTGFTEPPDSGTTPPPPPVVDSGPSCAAPAQLCGSSCVQTSVDPANCGACGKACNAGDFCVGGKCTATCAAGNVVCGTECLDPRVSNQHCGATAGCGADGGSAGTACAAGQVCSAGVCAATCQAPQINCGGTCIDPQTNDEHCGASAACNADAGTGGTACTATQACQNGVCFELAPTLTVQKTGTGAADGTVTSNVGGINCGATCSRILAPGTVTLTANVTNGATFLGWSGGGCSGTGTCIVSVTTAPTAVTAAFSQTSSTFSANGTYQTGTPQTWNVPPSVTMVRIQADGAAGCVGYSNKTPYGARMIGTFPVTPGQTLTMRVGQTPQGYAGGGGTFVVQGNTLLVAAGGGGCAGVNSPIAQNEVEGRTGTSGGTAGATARADNGAGGNVVAGQNSGGGGGWLTDGAGTGYGRSYPNASTGATGEANSNGGYGGGGARTGLWGQGAGGGYSGGSCGDSEAAMTWEGCGGGGSYSTGTEQTNTAGVVQGAGQVVIQY